MDFAHDLYFIAYRCGHCKKTKPDYASFATEFRDAADKVVAAVDCSNEQSLCQ